MNTDWIQRKDAKLQRRKGSEKEFTNRWQSKCAESATDISPGLRGTSYPGFATHKMILPLLLERGEGRGEESSQNAYEFAGRLLVPPEPLRAGLTQAIQTAEKAGFTEWDATGETALSFVANHIRRQFGVSSEVIAKRLRAEKLWPPTVI